MKYKKTVEVLSGFLSLIAVVSGIGLYSISRYSNPVELARDFNRAVVPDVKKYPKQLELLEKGFYAIGTRRMELTDSTNRPYATI